MFRLCTASAALVATCLAAVVRAGADTAVIQLNPDNFEKVLQGNENVLVEFFAPWCGHCKKLAPEYDKASTQLKGKFALGAIDCQAHGEFCSGHGIQGFPTLKIFQRGKDTPSEYKGGRTADSIVQTLTRLLQPAMVEAATADALAKQVFGEASLATAHPNVAAVLVGDVSDAVLKRVRQMADGHREDFVVAHVKSADAVVKFLKDTVKLPADSAAVLAAEKLKKGSVAVVRNLPTDSAFVDDHLTVYAGPHAADLSKVDIDQLAKWTVHSTFPVLGEIGPENYVQYRDAGLPLGYLFYTSADGDRSALVKAAAPVAEKFRGKALLVTIDGKRFSDHATYLGLDAAKLPAFAVQAYAKPAEGAAPSARRADESLLLKYPLVAAAGSVDALSTVALEKHVAAVVAGTLKPTMKSEPVPESNDGPVTVVVHDSYESVVLDKKRDTLLEVYAPWCGHCKKLEPAYADLGKLIKEHGLADKIVIAKMDGTANDMPLNAGFNVLGFPTIKLVRANDNTVIDFDGERNLAGFLQFLKAKAVHGSTIDAAWAPSAPASGEHEGHEHAAGEDADWEAFEDDEDEHEGHDHAAGEEEGEEDESAFSDEDDEHEDL